MKPASAMAANTSILFAFNAINCSKKWKHLKPISALMTKGSVGFMTALVG
jgi:hypothetical protein